MKKPLHRLTWIAAGVFLLVGCAHGNRPTGGKNLWGQISQTASSQVVNRPPARSFDFKSKAFHPPQTEPLLSKKETSPATGALGKGSLLPEAPISGTNSTTTGQGPSVSILGGTVSPSGPSVVGIANSTGKSSAFSPSDLSLTGPPITLPEGKSLTLAGGASISGATNPAGGGFVARRTSPSTSAASPSNQGASLPVSSAPLAPATQTAPLPISTNSSVALVNSPSLTDSNIPRSVPRENFQTAPHAIVAGSGNSSTGPLPLVLPDPNPVNLPNPIGSLPPPSQALAPPEAPPPAGATGSQGNQPSESIGTSRTALALTAGLNPEPVEQFGEASNHPPGWQPTSTGQGLGHLFMLVNLAAPDGTITTATYETDDHRWPEQALKCFPDRPGNPDAPIFPGENRPALRFDSGPSSQGPWKQEGYGFKVSACGQSQISNTLISAEDTTCRGYMRVQATWSENISSPDGKIQKKHYRAEKIIGCENFENGQVPQKPLIQMELKEYSPQFERIMVLPNATSLLETE